MKTQVNKVKIMILAGLAVLTLAAAGIFYYLSSPSSMIAIDVNPSIEIHTNRLGQVVSIVPVNDDAVQLMAGYQLTDRNLETVIKNIVDRMILNGYLVNENTDEILLSGNKNSSNDLLNQVTASLNSYLQEKQLAVQVLNQKVDMDKEDLEAAHENKVSVGKMALINALVRSDSSLNSEELVHATVKQLMQYAASRNISLGHLVQNYKAALADQTVSVSPVPTADPTQTVSPAPTADPTQTVSPTPAADPTQAVSPTPAVTAAADDQTATATIIIRTGRNKSVKEDAGETDLEDADEADEGQNDAEIDNEDNNGNEKDSEHADTGKKTHKETAGAVASDTDAVSGASLNVNKNNSSADVEDNEDQDDDQDNNLQDNDLQDDEDNDLQDNEENEDGEHYLQDSSRHGDYQGEDNEDGNSQGDEGEDD